MKKLLRVVAVALIPAALLVANFLWEDSRKPWESGQLDVGNARITLPIPLADFQGKTNLKVEESSETIRSVQLDAQGKKGYDLGASLKVYVEDDMVTGIIANNKTLGGWIDPDMDALVTFPCSVSTRSTLAEVESRYSTGLFDFFKRESKKERSDQISPTTKAVCYINTFAHFSGDRYCVDVTESQQKDRNTDRLGTTMEIFYNAM